MQSRALAEALKAEGNSAFAKQFFRAAIDRYTEALTLSPDWSVLYVNRAICHKLKSPPEWDAVQRDTEKALELDSQNMKAHLFLGESLLEQESDLADSVAHLTKALELAREAKSDIKDQIWRSLARARYRSWEVGAADQAAEHAKMAERLTLLLREDHSKRLSQAEEGGQRRGELEREQAEEADALARLLERARVRRGGEEEVPDAFTCRLTMEVFREPMVTPSGLSYEQSALQEHLSKVGTFDPVSRKPVTVDKVVPNLGLRAATMHYLQEHPWAWADVC